jgi:hypothetical protein
MGDIVVSRRLIGGTSVAHYVGTDCAMWNLRGDINRSV